MTMPLERIKELLKPHYECFPGEMPGTRYEHYNLGTSGMIELGESALMHLLDGETFTDTEVDQIRNCLTDRARHLRFQERSTLWGAPGPNIYWDDIHRLEETLREFNYTLHPPKVSRLSVPEPQPEEPVRRSFFSRLLRASTPAEASF